MTKPLIKYLCQSSLSAFDLVEHIANHGGDVCMVMSGDDPTREVLSTYDMDSSFIVKQDPTDFDRKYFEEKMK